MNARRFHLPLLLVLLALAAGCDSPTSARPAELAGEWIGPTYTWTHDHTGPRAERRFLRLLADGEYLRVFHRSGEDRLPVDRPSSYEAVRGTWRVSGDRLVLRAASVERWRHTDGLDTPPRVEVLIPPEISDVRYELRNGALVLRWISTALDAPQEVEEVYHRAILID